MQKLDKKLYEKHAKRLEAILNPQSSFVPHLTRLEFNTILKFELNTLFQIEKKFPEEKLENKYHSKSLVKQFNELTKGEFKIDENYKYEDDGDLIDNINYLVTYCKNIFKVDLDDAVEGKKVVASNPNISFTSKTDVGEAPSMDGANAFNMGAMGYATSPLENPYLMGKAYAKLNKDIQSGKVYQYKTKPKAIKFVKLSLFILLLLSVAALVLTAIFCFMANGIKFNNSETTAAYSTITSGMFYLISAGFGIYVLVITAQSTFFKKGHVNENSLYSFNWWFYLAYIILALLITLLDLRITWFYSNYGLSLAQTSGTQYIGFKLWGYGIIATSVTAGLCIAPMIIGAVNAPKTDKEKLEEILKTYVNEINSTFPQPGPEVQKPVDVKPSEPKKETDKKTEKGDQPKK